MATHKNRVDRVERHLRASAQRHYAWWGQDSQTELEAMEAAQQERGVRAGDVITLIRWQTAEENA